MQDVGFLLLAGGQSRRMGGGDKNQLHLGGKSVLQHVLDRVDRAGSPTAINANGDPQRFAGYGLPIIADVVDGYAGPLAGILTGLEWMAAYHPNHTHSFSAAAIQKLSMVCQHRTFYTYLKTPQRRHEIHNCGSRQGSAADV